jgi:hypothetical protein
VNGLRGALAFNFLSIFIAMIRLQIKNHNLGTGSFYHLSTDYFDSLLPLLIELYQQQPHGQSDLFEIEDLLDALGYRNLKLIPQSETEKVRNIIRSNAEERQLKRDPEQLAYRLMAAILADEVVVILNNRVVDNPETPIQLLPDSNISIILKAKLDSISFISL